MFNLYKQERLSKIVLIKWMNRKLSILTTLSLIKFNFKTGKKEGLHKESDNMRK